MPIIYCWFSISHMTYNPLENSHETSYIMWKYLNDVKVIRRYREFIKHFRHVWFLFFKAILINNKKEKYWREEEKNMSNCFLFSKKRFQMYMVVSTLLNRTSTWIEEELNTELIDRFSLCTQIERNHFKQSGHFPFHYCDNSQFATNNTLFKDLRCWYFVFLFPDLQFCFDKSIANNKC